MHTRDHFSITQVHLVQEAALTAHMHSLARGLARLCSLLLVEWTAASVLCLAREHAMRALLGSSTLGLER